MALMTSLLFCGFPPPPSNLCRLEPESLITVPLLPLDSCLQSPLASPGKLSISSLLLPTGISISQGKTLLAWALTLLQMVLLYWEAIGIIKALVTEKNSLWNRADLNMNLSSEAS